MAQQFTNNLSPRPSVTLVGTVHFSGETHSRVVQTITEESPDVVAIELDEQRLYELQQQSSLVTDAAEHFLAGDLSARGALTTALFVRIQRKLQQASSYRPGHADMLPAVNTGLKTDSSIALIDTLEADAMDSLGGAAKADLLSVFNQVLTGDLFEVIARYNGLAESQSDTGLASATSIESLIDQFETVDYDALEAYLTDIEIFLPTATEQLLHERNRKMAGHLHWLDQNNYSTVAIIGKAHVPGIREYLNSPETLPDEYIVQPPYHTTQ